MHDFVILKELLILDVVALRKVKNHDFLFCLVIFKLLTVVVKATDLNIRIWQLLFSKLTRSYKMFEKTKQKI